MLQTNEQSSVFRVTILTNSGRIVLKTEYIDELYFIEDIFSFSIMGKLRFVDKEGIMEFGPITGNEILHVIYGGEPFKEIFFKIFAIDNVSGITQPQGASSSIYELNLVDMSYFPLTQRRYSLSWKNESISKIVANIDEHLLGIKSYAKFEESREKLEYFYIPYWTPLEALKWLMKRCSGKESGQPGYVHYNNSNGLNFITLEKLFQNKEIEIDPDTKQILQYKFNPPEDENNDNKIISWEMSHVDFQSHQGLRGGHRLGYEFETKSLLDNEHTYKSSLAQFTLLGQRSLFMDCSDVDTKISLEGESETDILDNIHNDEFIKRYSRQLIMIVNVEGHEKRHAGMMVVVDWPSVDSKEIFNKGFEGFFLVKSVTHHFSGTKTPVYSQKMVMMKTGYASSDVSLLEPATKMNLSPQSKRRLGK